MQAQIELEKAKGTGDQRAIAQAEKVLQLTQKKGELNQKLSNAELQNFVVSDKAERLKFNNDAQSQNAASKRKNIESGGLLDAQQFTQVGAATTSTSELSSAVDVAGKAINGNISQQDALTQAIDKSTQAQGRLNDAIASKSGETQRSQVQLTPEQAKRLNGSSFENIDINVGGKAIAQNPTQQSNPQSQVTLTPEQAARLNGSSFDSLVINTTAGRSQPTYVQTPDARQQLEALQGGLTNLPQQQARYAPTNTNALYAELRGKVPGLANVTLKLDVDRSSVEAAKRDLSKPLQGLNKQGQGDNRNSSALNERIVINSPISVTVASTNEQQVGKAIADNTANYLSQVLDAALSQAGGNN